jgi:hypothetical protein
MKRIDSGSRPFLVGLAVILLAGCAGSLMAREETPGQHFDRVMKEFAATCAKAKLKPNDTACDILKLKPADPLATEGGRFAHSIKIPNPVPEDSGYKPGMTQQEYFDHLCKTEAGEFIYKTMENVEGLYMMRPRNEASDYEMEHLYALEDPYGHENGEGKEPEFLFVEPNRYSFFEMPLLNRREQQWKKEYRHESYFTPPVVDARYARYSGYDARKMKTMVKEYAVSRESRYGYTWRGITRPHDRDLGIAGGELIVLDLETNEVLGVRRGFIRTGAIRNNLTGVWWLTGQACPAYGLRNGRNKDFDFSYWFIGKVLKPTNYERSFQELIHAK